jgi:hypothetical protein
MIVEKRDHLPISPDPALIQRLVGEAPFAPDALQFLRVVNPVRVRGFQQPAALRAVVDNFGDRIAGAAVLFETDQFSGHEL